MEILFLGAALVACIWGLAFLRTTGLFGLVVATLILGTVFGHPFFHISALSLDRLLLVLAFGFYAIQRWCGFADAKPWGSVDTVLALFLLVLTLSVLTHDWRTGKAEPVSRLIFYYIMPVTIYWLARQSHISPTKIKWFYVSLAAFGLYIALTACMERMGWTWAVFPRYISSPNVSDFLGRGRGPLLNPSGNGILMVFAMFSMIMLVPRLGRTGRMVLTVLLGVYLLGIYSTLTRCAWLGGIGALGILVMIVLPKTLRLPVAVSAVMAAVLFVGVNWERLVAFKRDKDVSIEDMQESASLRPILAVIAWKIFQDYPVFGCGMGQYLTTAKDYLGDRDVDFVLEKVRPYVQHNVFLSLLTETGIVGVSLFTLLISIWTWHAWQLWQTTTLRLEYRQLGLVFVGTLFAYLTNGMFQDVLIIPMVNMYLFFLAGLVQNVAAQAKGYVQEVGQPNRRSHAELNISFSTQ